MRKSSNTGTITWSQNRNTGRGELTIWTYDGKARTIEHEDPITASTDSHSVAAMFGNFTTIDHDGDTIHVAAD